MVSQCERKLKKLANKIDGYLGKITSSYCPICGEMSPLVNYSAAFNQNEVGDSAAFNCPFCGEFSVTKGENGWTVDGWDVPYIMAADNNAATLLHKFDDSKYTDECKRVSDKVMLICRTAVNYNYVGELETAENMIREAFGMSIDAMRSGIRDEHLAFFGCFSLFFKMASVNRIGLEETEIAVSDILDVCELYEKIHMVGVMTMCADTLDELGGTPNDRFYELFDLLSDSDPAEPPGGSAYRSTTYWEGLAILAVFLQKYDELDRLCGLIVGRWRELYSNEKPTDDDVDRMILFVYTINNNISDKGFDIVFGHVMEIASICSEDYPCMEDKLRIMRYEYRIDNGLCPYDRVKDLDAVIDKYQEIEDVKQARYVVNARLYRALDSEDISDAMADYEEALSIVIAKKLTDFESCEIVMDLAVAYYDAVADDKKELRSVMSKFRRIGVTKEKIKAWRKV